jgi:nicotinic acid mononucleotide adenylyltransferase
MISLALSDHKWIKLNEWESEQPKWPLTFDALEYHQNEVNKMYNNNNIKLIFLCGSDLFATFNTKNLWDENHVEQICSKYGIVIINRLGSNPCETISNNIILKKYKVNIFNYSRLIICS